MHDYIRTDDAATADELEDILAKMKELIQQAAHLVKTCSNRSTAQRAEGYWVAHIKGALDNEYGIRYSMTTMEDTINELRAESNPEEEDEEDLTSSELRQPNFPRGGASTRRAATRPTGDAFCAAYVEAALWSSTDDNGHALDKNYTVNDIDDESMQRMLADCDRFQHENAEALAAVADDEASGHDFWLTRTGHGAGFQDRDYDYPNLRREYRSLAKAATAYGEVSLYVGNDGLLYHYPA